MIAAERTPASDDDCVPAFTKIGEAIMSSAAVSKRPGRDRDVAVTLSTRIALSKRDLIDDVVEREGISIREVIERALETAWGSAV